MTDLCDACSEPIGSGSWIMLNRFGLYTGKGRVLTEIQNDDGEYLWDMDPEDESEEEGATGLYFHWPECLHTYIECKIVGTDYDLEKQGG